MNFLFFKLFLVQLQVFPFPKRLFSTVDDLVISPKWPNPTYIEYAKETHPLTVLLNNTAFLAIIIMNPLLEN